MGLRKFFISAGLACGLGLALIVGVVAFEPGNVTASGLDEAKIVQIAQKTEAAKPVNTERVEAAWRDWMGRTGVTKSSLAIGYDGKILHSVRQVRRSDMPYPMASLSKAITGMCLNQLLIDSPYSWESTLADLAPEFAKMNLTPAVEMSDLTLTQIATHTSGLPKILKYGTTSIREKNLSSQPKMTRAALGEPSNFGPRGSRVYSNANYAILGFLIEAMTGEIYADYCGAKIMVPAGATHAGVIGRMAYTAGYGGWSVSVEEYARFAMYWFDPAQPWMVTPTGFAYDRNANYGMGTNVYPRRVGTYVSHSGRWTHQDRQKPNIGALFFVRADGVTVVVNWDSSLDYDLYDDLYKVLQNAL